MHDFFAVRERYKHALFSVSCIVQVLEHLVTLSYIGVPVTINKDNNAVVHVIGAERVTSQVVKLELSDYWVSMSFITYMLYSQSLYRDHEALFHHERRQSSNVVLVAEFFKDVPAGELDVERITWLVTHHHTYTNVEGMDYQILLEADFLVNAGESEYSKQATENFCRKVYRTEAGTHLLKSMFLEKE